MDRKQKSILIVGVSSFLGSNLANFLKFKFKVIGTYFTRPVNIPGILSLPLDVLERDRTEFFYHHFRPDVTIFCVGVSSLKECEKDAKKAELLNINSLVYITELCYRFKSKMIYFSSSEVFSGSKKSYQVIDIPDGISVLGRTKLSGEYFLEKNSIDYLIFRLGKLYGRGLDPQRLNILEFIQWKMAKKQEVLLDESSLHGFLDVSYLAMIVELSIKKNLKNILFQVCTHDICSYYQFAKMFTRVFSLEESLIKLGSSDSPEGGRLRFALDVENLENYLDVRVPTVEESLGFSYRRWSN
jgi:dTDP-4-dehydrorhamnose reductase